MNEPSPAPPARFRSTWSGLTEEQLLAQCDVDTYRASGPGGQKRNKTSSAVRLRHLPSGLLVIAEESRSQHDNKAKALKRLRRAIFLELRNPLPAELTPETILTIPEVQSARSRDGRYNLSPRHADFWPFAGVVLDLISVCEAQVSRVAELLGTTTANLVEFLQSDPKLWQEVNRFRVQCGQKPLRSG